MIFDVVMISGKMGSGKSTLCAELRKEILAHKRWAVEELIFAGAIYDMHNFCLQYLRDCGVDRGRKDGKLLQLLGTEWGRKSIDEEIWVDVFKSRLNKLLEKHERVGIDHLVVIVPDVRFPNELAASPGSLNIRLECDEETRRERCVSWRDDVNHPSEVGLDDHIQDFHFVFDTGKVSAREIARTIFWERLAT
jgi:hypothetical protein